MSLNARRQRSGSDKDPVAGKVKRVTGGAILALLLSVASQPSFSPKDLPAHVLAAVLGGLAGWLVDSHHEQTVANARYLERLEAVLLELELQKRPLGLMSQCPEHGKTLKHLIVTSAERFQQIAHVSPAEYLELLQTAIDDSRCYQGVQRKPIRWFFDDSHSRERYLRTLRDASMRTKVRIFVIACDDVEAMREDLAGDVCARYWKMTGTDVASYWIAEDALLTHYGLEPPRDCALYDGRLTIEYEQKSQLLTYDIVPDTESDNRLRIFRELERAVKYGGHFERIEPPRVR